MTVPFSVEAARRVTESVMADTCLITRDAEGPDDDTLDSATGLLVRPAGEPSTVYAGKCWVRPGGLSRSLAERNRAEGGAYFTAQTFDAAIPVSATIPLPGDEFTITAASTDATLVGRVFRVSAVDSTTFAVDRRLRLELRT